MHLVGAEEPRKSVKAFHRHALSGGVGGRVGGGGDDDGVSSVGGSFSEAPLPGMPTATPAAILTLQGGPGGQSIAAGAGRGAGAAGGQLGGGSRPQGSG